MPSPTIDWHIHDGVKDIPVEEPDGAELSHSSGGWRTARLCKSTSLRQEA